MRNSMDYFFISVIGILCDGRHGFMVLSPVIQLFGFFSLHCLPYCF